MDAIQRGLEVHRNRQRELDRIAKGLGKRGDASTPQSPQEVWSGPDPSSYPLGVLALIAFRIDMMIAQSLKRAESETLEAVETDETVVVMEQ